MIEPAPGTIDKAIWPAQDEAGNLVGTRSLFDGSVAWPAMVLRSHALEHNLAALAEFCREHDLDFAPHGKTSMAPRLFARQWEAGAVAITLATARQALVAAAAGVPRVLIANEVLDETAIAALIDAFDDSLAPGAGLPTISCFVDSTEGVDAIARAVRAARAVQPATGSPAEGGGFGVHIDVGYLGGRTGVRSAEAAIDLARHVEATEGVRLVGVGSYEGGLGSTDEVDDYFATVRGVVERLREASLLAPGGIVTAGGSAYFDRVAFELGGQWATDQQVRVVLRSGAYVSHDDGTYVGKTAFNRIPGHLDAAIQVWAQVISASEDGLVILGMGKRDAPYDSGMPVPLVARRQRDGRVETVDLTGEAGTDATTRAAEITKMDDQHAYLLLDGVELRPGDLVCSGISHPCTAFDKWRALPIVDDEDRVVEVVRTYF